MYLAHVAIFLFYCNICLINTFLFSAPKKPKLANLMPITSMKMEAYNNLKSFGSVFPIDGSCLVLTPDVTAKPVSLYVDLLTNYEIHLVRLRGKSLSIHNAFLLTSLDGKHLENFWFANNYSLQFEPAATGRLIEISTVSRIRLCSIEVFSCKVGWTGRDCEEECADGYFGMSCRSLCDCLCNITCDRKTGVCPDGCPFESMVIPDESQFGKVKVAPYDVYSVTETEVLSINQGPTLDLLSSRVYKPSEQCISVASQCSSTFLFLELDLLKPIHLYGVEMTFTKFHLPAPFSIYITANGKACYGETVKRNSITLGTHVFKCQRRNLIGKYILVRFTTYNTRQAMNAAGVEVYVCRLRALECSPGFYGRHCRQICSCAGNDCDKATGACFEEKCGSYSRGPYCSSIDVMPKTVIARMVHYDSGLTDSHSNTYNHPYLPSHPDSFHKWLAIQFDDVYVVNSFTVIVPGVPDEVHKSIQVFTDASMSITNMSIAHFEKWPGLPCTVKDPEISQVSHHVKCPSLVKTLFLVIISDSVFLDISRASIKMFTCVDGTFGPECEHSCNCKDISESCDKISGVCLSGCAEGYKGFNCTQVCEAKDGDPTCPTQTCHCLGEDQSYCGPELPLCSHGCQAGWMGVSCSLPCPSGFFGPDCEEECGNCLYDTPGGKEGPVNNTSTCLPTNGTCTLGCADPADTRPTCRSGRTSRSSATPRFSEKIRAEEVREARHLRIIEDSSVHVVLGLVAVISACSTLIILVCCSLKCYWDRVARSRRLNEKKLEMMVRRAMHSNVDKIHGDHQQFHESFVKRDIMKKLGEKHHDTSKARAKAKAEAIRLMILEMENQRRIHRVPAEEGEEEDDEQDPDQKVAFWILTQNFSELIDRRRKRLREYKGNILEIKESPYRISEVSEIEDIHALYDDLEHLAIP